MTMGNRPFHIALSISSVIGGALAGTSWINQFFINLQPPSKHPPLGPTCVPGSLTPSCPWHLCEWVIPGFRGPSTWRIRLGTLSNALLSCGARQGFWAYQAFDGPFSYFLCCGLLLWCLLFCPSFAASPARWTIGWVILCIDISPNRPQPTSQWRANPHSGPSHLSGRWPSAREGIQNHKTINQMNTSKVKLLLLKYLPLYGCINRPCF